MTKKLTLILIAIAVAVCSIGIVLFLCSNNNYAFKETKEGKIISREDGTEYNLLAYESWIICLGEYEHIGRVRGEGLYLRHMGGKALTGMYRPESGDRSGVLKRVLPNSEWNQIYRNAALPELDLSIDNLVRIEWVNCQRYHLDASHATCGYGLTGEKMHDFFKEVYSCQTADEAKLIDLVRKPNGSLENCYAAATVFGYFEDEPNIAFAMTITSYNDKAYTIELPYEDYYEEFVIPDNWLEELTKASHTSKIED